MMSTHNMKTRSATKRTGESSKSVVVQVKTMNATRGRPKKSTPKNVSYTLKTNSTAQKLVIVLGDLHPDRANSSRRHSPDRSPETRESVYSSVYSDDSDNSWSSTDSAKIELLKKKSEELNETLKRLSERKEMKIKSRLVEIRESFSEPNDVIADNDQSAQHPRPTVHSTPQNRLPKRGRGRPKKIPIQDLPPQKVVASEESSREDPPVIEPGCSSDMRQRNAADVVPDPAEVSSHQLTNLAGDVQDLSGSGLDKISASKCADRLQHVDYVVVTPAMSSQRPVDSCGRLVHLSSVSPVQIQDSLPSRIVGPCPLTPSTSDVRLTSREMVGSNRGSANFQNQGDAALDYSWNTVKNCSAEEKTYSRAKEAPSSPRSKDIFLDTSLSGTIVSDILGSPGQELTLTVDRGEDGPLEQNRGFGRMNGIEDEEHIPTVAWEAALRIAGSQLDVPAESQDKGGLTGMEAIIGDWANEDEGEPSCISEHSDEGGSTGNETDKKPVKRTSPKVVAKTKFIQSRKLKWKAKFRRRSFSSDSLDAPVVSSETVLRHELPLNVSAKYTNNSSSNNNSQAEIQSDVLKDRLSNEDNSQESNLGSLIPGTELPAKISKNPLLIKYNIDKLTSRGMKEKEGVAISDAPKNIPEPNAIHSEAEAKLLKKNSLANQALIASPKKRKYVDEDSNSENEIACNIDNHSASSDRGYISTELASNEGGQPVIQRIVPELSSDIPVSGKNILLSPALGTKPESTKWVPPVIQTVGPDLCLDSHMSDENIFGSLAPATEPASERVEKVPNEHLSRNSDGSSSKEDANRVQDGCRKRVCFTRTSADSRESSEESESESVLPFSKTATQIRKNKTNKSESGDSGTLRYGKSGLPKKKSAEVDSDSSSEEEMLSLRTVQKKRSVPEFEETATEPTSVQAGAMERSSTSSEDTFIKKTGKRKRLKSRKCLDLAVLKSKEDVSSSSGEEGSLRSANKLRVTPTDEKNLEETIESLPDFQRTSPPPLLDSPENSPKIEKKLTDLVTDSDSLSSTSDEERAVPPPKVIHHIDIVSDYSHAADSGNETSSRVNDMVKGESLHHKNIGLTASGDNLSDSGKSNEKSRTDQEKHPSCPDSGDSSEEETELARVKKLIKLRNNIRTVWKEDRTDQEKHETSPDSNDPSEEKTELARRKRHIELSNNVPTAKQGDRIDQEKRETSPDSGDSSEEETELSRVKKLIKLSNNAPTAKESGRTVQEKHETSPDSGDTSEGETELALVKSHVELRNNGQIAKKAGQTDQEKRATSLDLGDSSEEETELERVKRHVELTNSVQAATDDEVESSTDASDEESEVSRIQDRNSDDLRLLVGAKAGENSLDYSDEETELDRVKKLIKLKQLNNNFLKISCNAPKTGSNVNQNPVESSDDLSDSTSERDIEIIAIQNQVGETSHNSKGIISSDTSDDISSEEASHAPIDWKKIKKTRGNSTTENRAIKQKSTPFCVSSNDSSSEDEPPKNVFFNYSGKNADSSKNVVEKCEEVKIKSDEETSQQPNIVLDSLSINGSDFETKDDIVIDEQCLPKEEGEDLDQLESSVTLCDNYGLNKSVKRERWASFSSDNEITRCNGENISDCEPNSASSRGKRIKKKKKKRKKKESEVGVEGETSVVLSQAEDAPRKMKKGKSAKIAEKVTPKKGKIAEKVTPEKGKIAEKVTPEKGKIAEKVTPEKGKIAEKVTPKKGKKKRKAANGEANVDDVVETKKMKVTAAEDSQQVQESISHLPSHFLKDLAVVKPHSSIRKGEMIPTKKIDGKKKTKKRNIESEDFIPLIAKGSTHFGAVPLDGRGIGGRERAVANFKEEMLFGSRVKRAPANFANVVRMKKRSAYY